MYAKKDLIILWEKEKLAYQTKEIGSGVQLFVKKLLQCKEIFDLYSIKSGLRLGDMKIPRN